MFASHLVWRAATLPVSRDACARELDNGLFTHRGQDKEGRPVFVYQGSKHDPESSVAAVLQAVLYTMEGALAGMGSDTDGKVIIIFHIDRGSKFDSQARDLIRQFASIMSDNYPERCCKAMIFPGTPLAFALWNVVKYLLDARQREKVVIVANKPEGRRVFESFVSEDQLQLVGIAGWGRCMAAPTPARGPE